jgi:hypothetical protein
MTEPSTIAPSLTRTDGGGFKAGYPSRATSVELYDELDYQRAVQAYIWATPLVSSVALVKALFEAGISPTEPALFVLDHRAGPKQVIMSASSEVIYAFSVLDLRATGPMVLEVPAGMSGAIWDMWGRGLADLGIGRSEGRDRFLLVPPGSWQESRDDLTVVSSRTPRIMIAARATIEPGKSLEPAVELVASLALYPLARKRQATETIMNGNKPFDCDWPRDFRFFEYLSEGLSDAPIESHDKLMYAMLEPLGIVPGQRFAPDERQRRILTRAAATGSAMMANLAYANRAANRRLWSDRMWERSFATTTPTSETARRIELDERAQTFHQYIGNGLFVRFGNLEPGKGQWCASTYRDASGAFLDGSQAYRLTLEDDPPARLFWSLTLYDNRTRSMIDTDQQIAALGTHSLLQKNEDGSTDLVFAPRPPAGLESNWIKTIPARGFFATFRLYGPLQPLYHRSWKLPDLQLVPTRRT